MGDCLASCFCSGEADASIGRQPGTDDLEEPALMSCDYRRRWGIWIAPQFGLETVQCEFNAKDIDLGELVVIEAPTDLRQEWLKPLEQRRKIGRGELVDPHWSELR